MANMTFGVNLIPKTNNTYTLGNSTNKWNIYANQINGESINNYENSAIQSSMAILADNNTHIAITSGQFVYVRNHSTLTEGLYEAIANIAQNATLSTSNLTAASTGGFNALNSKLETHGYDTISSFPYTALHTGTMTIQINRGQGSTDIVFKTVSITDSSSNKSFQLRSATASTQTTESMFIPVIKGHTYTVSSDTSIIDFNNTFVVY